VTVERFRKKPIVVETMLWDGTQAAADAISEWCGGNVLDWWTGPSGALIARLWVAHQDGWAPLPVGHRVAREADGNGFYPISPQAIAETYEPAEA
jgi:hypothetical protein